MIRTSSFVYVMVTLATFSFDMTSERNVDIAVERRGECMLIMLEQAVSPVLFYF